MVGGTTGSAGVSTDAALFYKCVAQCRGKTPDRYGRGGRRKPNVRASHVGIGDRLLTNTVSLPFSMVLHTYDQFSEAPVRNKIK